ncbi:MAG: nitroreductase family protein [Desulfobacteraceae bacterium]
MMDFAQLMEQRRSIREYLDKPVPRSLILQIIQDACQAPSAANNQPWQFILVLDKQMIKLLSDEAKKNIIAGIKKQPDSPIASYLAQLEHPSFNIFHDAPALVYIVGDPRIPSLVTDVSLAAAYFMFSATTRGMGTCWIGLGREIRDPELLSSIGVPGGFTIIAPIVVGYPRRIPPAPSRNAPKILKIVE